MTQFGASPYNTAMSDETALFNDEGEANHRVAQLLPLRDGRHVLLRTAYPTDARALLGALNEVANEGRFLLRRAWEITPELEQRWVSVALGDSDLVLVAMLLDNPHTRAEQEIVGGLSLVRGRPEFVRHTAELAMWLRAAYRELGLGSAMLEYALTWLRAGSDIEKITLSARSSNRRALNLYRKYGFVEEGRREGFIKTEQGYEAEVLLSRFVRGPLLARHADGPFYGPDLRGLPQDDDELGDTGG